MLECGVLVIHIFLIATIAVLTPDDSPFFKACPVLDEEGNSWGLSKVTAELNTEN
jgi:hypothetical protein